MTVHHGKDGVVKVGTTTVAKTQKWSYTEEVAIVDASSQGEDWESHLPGLKKLTGSFDYLLDTADAGQITVVVGASVTLNLYPDGAGAGATYKTMTVTLTSIATNSDKSNANMRTAQFTANGEASDATVAS